jgi:diguanylate cyclase (GGDEF)-like protein/PAS domain S-box-containing protein
VSKRPSKAVLLIEHDPEEARLIRAMFGNQGDYSFALTHVDCLADAESHLALEAVDVVLLDLSCPDAPGLDGVLRTHAATRGASIVLLSSQKDEPIAVQAIAGGAQDYLIKGQIESHELMRALRNSVSRKILEETLFSEKSRAQVTLDSIGDAVICTDTADKISFLNPIAERMTGWSLKEAFGLPLSEAFRIMDASTGKTAADPIAKAVGQGRTTKLPANCILTRRDGHQIFIEDSVAPIVGSDGVAAGTVLVFRDVTAARGLADQITHLAEHDALTGLPNRLLLNDRLNQAIAQAGRKGSQVAVLFLDLDGFKHINDSLGHPAGDKLLRSVAQRLQECLRSPDTISRQGGDEFVVLLQDLHQSEQAAHSAKRMLKCVSEPHSIDGHELHITASMGISIYPDDGLDAETLIKNADTAMYQAKESGRQVYRFFTPEMNVQAVERQSLEEDLRRALERRELSLHYQPIVNLKTGVITGAEALLRWTHPTRGSISPAQFIPIAEDSGLILPIGAWVLKEACMQAKAWLEMGLPAITLSVNVSALQFRSEGFLEALSKTLDETGMNPESLDIEVTESALMERGALGGPILDSLRDRGMHIAIDDFGTGYSSLSYLSNLSLDALKIDQSFVRQISGAPSDTSIVSAVIGMGRNLKLKVIAEGVETAEEMAFLMAQECDEAQGFFFSQPVNAFDFAKLLQAKVN